MQISTQELFYFFGFVLILFLCCQALLVNGELMRRPGIALAAACFLSVLTDVFYMLVWRNGLAQCAH